MKFALHSSTRVDLDHTSSFAASLDTLLKVGCKQIPANKTCQIQELEYLLVVA